MFWTNDFVWNKIKNTVYKESSLMLVMSSFIRLCVNVLLKDVINILFECPLLSSRIINECTSINPFEIDTTILNST